MRQLVLFEVDGRPVNLFYGGIVDHELYEVVDDVGEEEGEEDYGSD